MEKELNKKIIAVSFVVSAALAYIIVQVLFKTAAASFGPVQKLWSQELFQHGVPVLAAVITFAALQFNANIKIWADEVVTELLKVVWPSKKDTTAMTIVCCVMLIISGVVLFAFDKASALITEMLFEIGKMVS